MLIDLSHWNGAPNYEHLDPRVEGIIVKATQGTLPTPDVREHYNVAGAQTANKPIGVYHFFVAGEDGQTQADAFLKATEDVADALDIAPVIDIEQTKGVAAATMIAEIQAWISAVQTERNKEPIIYSGAGFWLYQLANTSAFNHLRLWVANYGVSHPRLFGGWNDYALWQYGKGAAQGIVGACDLDVLPQGKTVDSLF